MTSTLDDGGGTNDNTYTFTVNFSNPCATFTAPSSPADYEYKIGTGPYSFDIAAWTKGDSDCSYSEALTMSPSHSWISLSTR